MIDSQPSSTHSGGSSGSLIRNYLGFPRGISGASLATRAFGQAWSSGAIPSMAGPVTGLQPAADGFTLRLADDQVSLTRSVLITTGVSYRRLDAPGLDSLPGAGVFYGATASEAAAFAREHVFIIGGANSAGQAAVNQAHIMTGSGSHPAPLPELPPTEHNGGSRAPIPAPPSPSVTWVRVPPCADRSRQGEHPGAKVSRAVGDHWTGMPAKPGSPPVTSERRFMANDAYQGRTHDWPRALPAFRGTSQRP